MNSCLSLSYILLKEECIGNIFFKIQKIPKITPATICLYLWLFMDIPGGSDGKVSTMWETWVRSLDWEDPLEKEMAIHSSTIAWKISWTEEPGRITWRRKWQSTPVLLPGKSHGQRSLVGYSPMGSRRVRHDWATSLSLSGTILSSLHVI